MGGDATPRAITPVLLCGGEGTRLWPLSRPERPKPLLPLGTGPSLLADTLARFDAARGYGPPLLVCAAPSAAAIAEQHPEMERLVEADPTGTAGAVLAAAARLPRDRMMLVAPADHAIGDPAPIHDAVERGAPVAVAGAIVLFGLVPRHAESGFGWIVAGDTVSSGIRRVVRFEEKPAPARASELFASFALWNSGIFLLLAGTALDVARDLGLPPVGRLRGSFDRVVVERAPSIAVAPIDLDWSDLGTWEVLRARNGVGMRHALFPGDPVPAGAIRILEGTVEDGRAGPHGAIVEALPEGEAGKSKKLSSPSAAE